jgi:hypothetical protein
MAITLGGYGGGINPSILRSLFLESNQSRPTLGDYMDHIDAMRAFVRVTGTGSFT